MELRDEKDAEAFTKESVVDLVVVDYVSRVRVDVVDPEEDALVDGRAVV